RLFTTCVAISIKVIGKRHKETYKIEYESMRMQSSYCTAPGRMFLWTNYLHPAACCCLPPRNLSGVER
ncbi:hypothetical protein J6590_058734, partial [Homalodisca vitripennis]